MRSSVIAITCVLLIGGCKSAQVSDPLMVDLAGNDPESQMEFWYQLGDRRLVSNDAAFHALLLFLENEDPVQTYEARVEVLKSRGMLPLNFDRPADDAVHRGNLAVAICRILEIKGGGVMRVFKPSRRYAVRELVYLGIYPLSSPYQTFSGGDFVALIGRMEDIQRARGGPDPPLPQEELPAGG